MGNAPSLSPDTTNTCTDTGDDESNNVDIVHFCTPPTFIGDANSGPGNDEDPTDVTTRYCHRYGGTYSPGNQPGPNGEFPEPEWEFSSLSDYGACRFAANPPNEALSDNFFETSKGVRGRCTRKMNSGDPLICALRDFQCNGQTQISNPACFSDNKLNSTCSKEFRAPDTIQSNFLLNQFCLGNIPGAIQNYSGSTGLKDSTFLELWADDTNPFNQDKWTITGLPDGTKYATSTTKISDCGYDKGGNPTSCSLSTWGTGLTYLPNPDPYQFGGSLPPCQQIFWRTLFGNQPQFKNNFYKIDGSQSICPDGSQFCDNTSIPPQAAACGAVPFGGIPTPTGLENARFLLESALEKYKNVGGNLIDGTNELNPAFRNWVYSVCQAYPNLCGNFLRNDICNNVTLEQAKIDRNVLEWCGCYLDKVSAYDKYVNSLGVSKECSPFCNIPNVIPSYDTNTGEVKYCTQSVCIIDDVTMTLAKTRFEGTGQAGGNINFNQICNSCSATGNNGTNVNTQTSANSVNASSTAEGVITGNVSTSCQCILDGFTLTSVGATIEGGINISQACNGNAQCYSNGSTTTGESYEVDCHGDSISQNNVIKQAEAELIKKANNTTSYWIILGFIILIIGIFIAWLLIAPRGVPETDKIYTKKINLPTPIPPTIMSGNMKPSKVQYY